jgi:hypothetical protein
MKFMRTIPVVLCALSIACIGVIWTISQDFWEVAILERGVVENPPYRID